MKSDALFTFNSREWLLLEPKAQQNTMICTETSEADQLPGYSKMAGRWGHSLPLHYYYQGLHQLYIQFSGHDPLGHAV